MSVSVSLLQCPYRTIGDLLRSIPDNSISYLYLPLRLMPVPRMKLKDIPVCSRHFQLPLCLLATAVGLLLAFLDGALQFVRIELKKILGVPSFHSELHVQCLSIRPNDLTVVKAWLEPNG